MKSPARIGSTIRWFLERIFRGKSIAKYRAVNSGLMFHGQVREVHLRHIAKYGVLEPDITKWVAGYLSGISAPGIFIDVGANIGWHTLHAARFKCIESVVACEPDSFNAYILNQNITENGAQNVTVAPWALAAESGRKPLFRYKPTQRGRHSLLVDHGLGHSYVPVMGLDSTLELLGFAKHPIHLMKIDTEGYELEVVRGGAEALKRTAALVMELSTEILRAGGYPPEELFDRIHGAGFSPHVLGEQSELVPIDRDWFCSKKEITNVIWTRKTA